MPPAANIQMARVVGAHQAFTERQVGADWALRQSLVDLASVCELLAGELERPTAAWVFDWLRRGRRRGCCGAATR